MQLPCSRCGNSKLQFDKCKNHRVCNDCINVYVERLIDDKQLILGISCPMCLECVHYENTDVKKYTQYELQCALNPGIYKLLRKTQKTQLDNFHIQCKNLAMKVLLCCFLLVVFFFINFTNDLVDIIRIIIIGTCIIEIIEITNIICKYKMIQCLYVDVQPTS